MPVADPAPEVGVTPLDPGAFGTFETLTPIFDPGYKVLFQTIQTHPQVQPKVPNASSDPRGVLPNGLVPAKAFSYEIFEQVTDPVNPIPFQASEGDFIFNQVTGEVPCVSVTKNCVIAFEGHDVVDFPTAGLPPGTGINCPTNVFMPIYCGGKFIAKQGDDLTTKSSLEYMKRSDGNGVKGIVPNDNLPLDSILNPNGMFNSNTRNDPYLVDATSNVIDAKGEFVTYVAIDKPIFRDVITARAGAVAQGVFVNSSFVATFIGPYGTPSVYVIRYAMTNIGTKDKPKMRWRMSESFGIDPEKKVDPPAEVYKTNNEAVNAAVFAKHYAYDLNDPSPDIENDFVNSTPKKTGYNPFHALAMTDSTSPLYNPTFKASVVGLKAGSEFAPSNFNVIRIFPNYRNVATTDYSPYMNLDGVTQWRKYESPVHAGDFGPNLRLGVEYTMHKTYASGVLSSVQTRSPAVILASTAIALPGISSYYDRALNSIVVIGVEGNTATERIVTDGTWEKSSTGTLKSFIVGENAPFKTGGRTCLYSRLNPKTVDAGNTISIPSGYLPFELVVSPPSSSPAPTAPPPLLTFGTLFEMSIPFAASAPLSVPVPPLTFSAHTSTNANGMFLKSVKCYPNKAFLPSLEQVAVPSGTAKDIIDQIHTLTAQDGPITCGYVTATIMRSGTLMAYSGSTVDIAFRHASTQPFLAVRDVVWRVGAGSSGSNTRPAASQPFIVSNENSKIAVLFYVYQSRILSKTIPYDIFTLRASTGIENGCLADTEEAALSAQIKGLGAFVAYDGHVKDPKSDIGPDLEANAIHIDSSDVAQIGDVQATPSISSYSVTVGNKSMYVMLKDNDKFIGRRSRDFGKTWVDIFAPGTRLVNASESPTSSASDPDADYPYCYADKETGQVMVFGFMDAALLSVNIPEDYLVADPEFIKDQMKTLKLKVIYGELSNNLESRGVKLASTVVERQVGRGLSSTEKETITAQRITVCRNRFGQHRLFYYDDKQFVHSLVSLDCGQTWLTEDQFIKNLKV